MLTSTTWINQYLDPPADAETQAELLTRAGFPLEGQTEIDGETQQDFEMTSNRGDCVCHFGLAREIAALSGRTLAPPPATPEASGGPASAHVTVENRDPEACPIYTARIIRGVKVGPSPAWLQTRLRTIGQIPRNVLVDATNYVLFELGQPTHVFDLAKLRGGAIIIRRAEKNEPFLPLGEGASAVKLTPDDLVIADAERAVAMAGVKGGAETAVDETTTDILLEAATFSPTSVRASSRRHQIASDSSYRFERGVHPAAVNAAADRLATLILELAGGELCEGVVSDGAPPPPPRSVTMRPSRARAMIGVDIPTAKMCEWLGGLGFETELVDEDLITCETPPHRLDIEREIDLVEEVARMYGLDRIPVAETISIRVAPPQSEELARSAVSTTLVGMGFVETITHSLVSEDAADAFLAAGRRPLMVDDERARANPVLRPSVLPSLLRVRLHNQNNGVTDLRLFESASCFWREGDGHHEVTELGLLLDAPDPQAGVRELRGVIDRLGRLLGGAAGVIDVREGAPETPWFSHAAQVILRDDRLGDDTLGVMGVISPAVQKQFDLDTPTVAASLHLTPLYVGYPPDAQARPLPAFPAISRDISAVVNEDVAWRDIETLIAGLDLPDHESTEFVTTFRGKQIGKRKKSVTLRIIYRAADRTLTNEEVAGPTDRVHEALQSNLKAEIRG